jgi:nucleoid DNA-binding protein
LNKSWPASRGRDAIQPGGQVHLNSLGTFYLTLISVGKESSDDMTADQITVAKIRFRPGKRLKQIGKKTRLHQTK